MLVVVAQPALSAAEWACRVRDNCSRYPAFASRYGAAGGCLYRESGRAFLYSNHECTRIDTNVPNIEDETGLREQALTCERITVAAVSDRRTMSNSERLRERAPKVER